MEGEARGAGWWDRGCSLVPHAWRSRETMDLTSSLESLKGWGHAYCTFAGATIDIHDGLIKWGAFSGVCHYLFGANCYTFLYKFRCIFSVQLDVSAGNTGVLFFWRR